MKSGSLVRFAGTVHLPAHLKGSCHESGAVPAPRTRQKTAGPGSGRVGEGLVTDGGVTPTLDTCGCHAPSVSKPVSGTLAALRKQFIIEGVSTPAAAPAAAGQGATAMVYATWLSRQLAWGDTIPRQQPRAHGVSGASAAPGCQGCKQTARGHQGKDLRDL